ncbi:MAG TPA: hypothetical protein VFT02_13770, partial [Pyrinomonadaceae bacterium]|nr:hypothetical protein [Pyrinomonadaceae bacterium]
MNRWLLRLGIAVLTFAAGYGIYLFSTAVFRSDRVPLTALPYCQVARNAEAYHEKNILVKAEVFVD